MISSKSSKSYDTSELFTSQKKSLESSSSIQTDSGINDSEFKENLTE